jgi:hypothetical protein
MDLGEGDTISTVARIPAAEIAQVIEDNQDYQP